jgi:hypothetical protein
MPKWEEAPIVSPAEKKGFKGAPVVSAAKGPRSLSESMDEELSTRNPWDRFWGGVGASMDRAAYGAKSLFTDLSPAEKQRLDLNKQITSTPAGFMGGVSGDVAMTYGPFGAVSGASSLIPSVAGRVGANVGGSAALGAGWGALTSPEDRAGGALAGGAGGAAGGLLGEVASGIFRPAAGSAARQLANEGVPLTVGQSVGGTARRIEDGLRAGSSGVARRQGEAVEAWSQNRVNQTLPDNAPPVGGTGRDAIQEGADSFNFAYDQAFGGMGRITPDQQLFTDLQAVVANYGPRLTQTDMTAMVEQLRRIGGEFNAGSLDGRALKDVRRSYQALAQEAFDAGNARLGEAYEATADALTGMATRQFPDAARQVAAVDARYADFLRVQRAAGKPGATGGIFAPAQLKQSARDLDKSVDKRAFARGNARMQPEAEVGEEVLGPTIPPVGPGTAEKMVIPLASQNLAMLWPYLGANLAYTRPIQAGLTGRLPLQDMIDPSWQGALAAATASAGKQGRKTKR